VIFTECVHCAEPIAVSLDERYLGVLDEGRQLIERVTCAKCGR